MKIKRGIIILLSCLLAGGLFFAMTAVYHNVVKEEPALSDAAFVKEQMTIGEDSNIYAICRIENGFFLYRTEFGAAGGSSFYWIDDGGAVMEIPYEADKFEKVLCVFSDSEGRPAMAVKRASRYQVKVLSEDGKVLSDMDITEALHSLEAFADRITDIRMDADGFLYVNTGNAVLACDEDGNRKGVISGKDFGFLRKLGSGMVAYVYNHHDGHVYVQCLKEGAPEEKYELPISGFDADWKIIDGLEYDIYYCDTANIIWGYHLLEKNMTQIGSLDESGIDAETVCEICPALDSGFYASLWDYGELAKPEQKLYALGRTLEKEEKISVILAGMNVDTRIRGLAATFNENNGEYQIIIKDYNEYEEPEKQLVLDVMSEHAPDILCLEGVGLHSLIAKGLLEDMYPYLESDYELSEFHTNILSLLETDGKLYQLPAGYEIGGWIGDETSVLGEENTGYVEGCTEYDLLLELVGNHFSDFVDYETKTCHFASGEFEKLLVLSEKRKDPEPVKDTDQIIDEIRGGKVLAVDILGEGDVLGLLQKYRQLFGREVSLMPYPSGGATGFGFLPRQKMAITSMSRKKDAAWKFLSMLYAPDYQYQESFTMIPLRKDCTEEYIRINAAREAYENAWGYQIEPFDGESLYGDVSLQRKPSSKEDIEQFQKVIEEIDHEVIYDNPIMDIVLEEAKAYYNQEKTSREVGESIQNRVAIYLEEQ
ncbi:MAG: hypothetical protein HDR01_04130 [Lachnospiraceae bacterium]|nr:hypothetical protein [Lachnospiraceae bacterium]